MTEWLTDGTVAREEKSNVDESSAQPGLRRFAALIGWQANA
jgi:hypothetical protein